MLLFLPGINVGSGEDFKSIDYGFVIFIAACMSIGSVGASLGIDQIVSNIAVPFLEGKNVIFVLAFMWLLCVGLNFLLTPLAIIAAFAVPLAQISLDLGINPQATYMMIMHGVDQLVLPYEIALYMIYYSFGLVYLKDFAKAMGVKLVINGIFVIAILFPFWKLIGFI